MNILARMFLRIRGVVGWIAVAGILLGCSDSTGPELKPIPPEVKAEFLEVPEKNYSRPFELWYAFEAVATQTPPDSTFWVLDQLAGDLAYRIGSGASGPGERAGHRWYISRSQIWAFRLIAWGPVAAPDTAYFVGPF